METVICLKEGIWFCINIKFYFSVTGFGNLSWRQNCVHAKWLSHATDYFSPCFYKELVKSHLAHKPCLFCFVESLNMFISVLLFVFWTVCWHDFWQKSIFCQKNIECLFFTLYHKTMNYWIFCETQQAKLTMCRFISVQLECYLDCGFKATHLYGLITINTVSLLHM